MLRMAVSGVARWRRLGGWIFWVWVGFFGGLVSCGAWFWLLCLRVGFPCLLSAPCFGCLPTALASPCFLSGLLASPLCGAALTFFAAAKKVSKESGLTPPACRCPSLFNRKRPKTRRALARPAASDKALIRSSVALRAPRMGIKPGASSTGYLRFVVGFFRNWTAACRLILQRIFEEPTSPRWPTWILKCAAYTC